MNFLQRFGWGGKGEGGHSRGDEGKRKGLKEIGDSKAQGRGLGEEDKVYKM